MRNLADAIERLGIRVKAVEQAVDRLVHRPRRRGPALDEARLDTVALRPPFVLYREGTVDGPKFGIQLGAIEQMPRQATKQRRNAKSILEAGADVGDAQLEGRMR